MSFRHVARDWVASGLAATGLTRPERSGEGRLSIATFHRVLPARERDAYPLPGLAVTPEELEWFVGYFTEHYTVGPLEALWDRFVRGERPEAPFLAVTFDDAQRDNARHAAPVLARHGVRASFYVPVANVEEARPLWHDRLGFALLAALGDDAARARAEASFGVPLAAKESVLAVAEAAKQLDARDREGRISALEASVGGAVPEWAAMMSWDEVRVLAAEGHEIGSHSMTHPILPRCTDLELEREVSGSRAALEERLGRAVRTFCYPNGDTDARVAAAARAAGYACAVTTLWGNNAAGEDAMRLKRWDMSSTHARDTRGRLSAARLAWRTSGLHPGLR